MRHRPGVPNTFLLSFRSSHQFFIGSSIGLASRRGRLLTFAMMTTATPTHYCIGNPCYLCNPTLRPHSYVLETFTSSKFVAVTIPPSTCVDNVHCFMFAGGDVPDGWKCECGHTTYHK